MIAGTALAVSGVLVFAGGSDLPFPPLPSMATAAIAVLAGGWMRTAARHRGWQFAAGLIAVSISFAVWTVRLDVEARGEAAAAAARAPRTPVQLLYDAARESEAHLGRTCGSRRFFVTTRLDEPLGLQDVAFTNFVFYAARDVAVTATVRPMDVCDYVISSRDVLTTRKGTDLLAALNPYGATVEIAEAGPFVLLGKR
jgi:hypothetical protein